MLEFANVFVGNTANDGTGTPLRNAFEIIDQNFANILAQGNAVAGVSSVAGRTGNVVLTVNDVSGAVSLGYVNTAITAGNTFVTQSIASAYSNIASSVYANVSTNLSGNIATVAEAIVANLGLSSQITAVSANVTAANSAISSISANLGTATTNISALLADNSATQANLGTATTNITALFSNAAGQATQLSTNSTNITAANTAISAISANLGGVVVEIVALQSNTATLASEINLVNANVTSANAYIVTLLGNAATVAGSINALNASIAAANLAITNSNFITTYELQANLTAANTNISTNATNLGLINANVTAANAAIATNTANISVLVANAGAQATTLNSIGANLGTATTNISALLADNASTQANIGNIVTNVSTLFSNASTQSTAITLVNANVTAANAAIATIQSNIGNTYSYVVATDAAITAANASINNILNGNIFATVSNLNNTNSALAATNANISAANTAINTNASTINVINTSVNKLIANVTTGYITVAGNITSGGDVIGAGFFWANGVSLVNSIVEVVNSSGNLQIVNESITSTTGKMDLVGYVGINNANPGATLSVGDGTSTASNNTGNIDIGFSNGNVSYPYHGDVTFDWDWYDGNVAGTNSSGGRHANFGLYKQDDGGEYFSQPLITFNYASGNVTVGNINSTSTIISAGDITADGNLYTIGGHLRTTAPIANIFNLTSTIYMGLGANAILMGNVNSTITAQGNLTVGSNVVAGNVLTNNHLYANGVSILAGVNAFETYANANIGTITTSLSTLSANVGAFETYANAHFVTSTYSNANVAAYLPTYTGNVSAGNVLTNNYLFANGVSILSSLSSTSISNGGSSVGFQGSGGNILLDVGGVQVATISQTQITVLGNVTAANIGLTGNTGHPLNTTTIVAWARVSVGGVAYWTPLYQ